MTILEICVVEPEYAFVCGAWGGLTADMIEKVELEIRENPPEGSAGKECIFVSAQWIDDEHDYIGGVKMVINPGYWDLNIVDAPVDYAALHPAADWTEADGVVLWWRLIDGVKYIVCHGTEPDTERTHIRTHWSRIPKVQLPAQPKEAK